MANPTRSGPRDKGLNPISDNHRQTGARKLDPRPESPGRLPPDFGESTAEAARHASHLMEPVNETQGKTHRADGTQPANVALPELDPAALPDSPAHRARDRAEKALGDFNEVTERTEPNPRRT